MDRQLDVSGQQVLRGVNLGNWLVLEKWMDPRVFSGTAARDEYTLSEALGPAAERHLQHHRDTWITADDFRWLAQRGINAVRIPFGYWIVDPDGPYIGSPAHLDRAVELAEEFGLKVLLDLHGLPGCQGPNDHSGRSGHYRWHREPRHLAHSLDVIEQVAQRYADRRSIVGFGVINEPEPEIGRDFLVGFFEQAHERVRRYMPADRVAFVISAFPENQIETYHGALGDRPNVWTDIHLYQNFGNWDDWRLLDYLAYSLKRQDKLQPYLQRGPVIVGEWSLGLAPPMLAQINAMPPVRRELILQAHGHMLLAMLEAYHGWFFWSYRVENRPEWSFRESVNRGWLPNQFS